LLWLLLQLSALVVSQLLQRCPDMNSKLRADYLIGDTEPGGRSACLSMDTKVCVCGKTEKKTRLSMHIDRAVFEACCMPHAASASAWIQRCVQAAPKQLLVSRAAFALYAFSCHLK
jgi:hypothetical protein